MCDIIIGADELILWLRKNGKAEKVPNAGNDGLGRRIYELIVHQCNGRKVKDSDEVYWPIDDTHSHIGDYQLPRTSAQYEVSVSQIGHIFEELNKM